MRTIYSFVLLSIFLCYSLSLVAQDPQENWVLNAAISGTKTYIARDSIVLKPGFSYIPSAGNTFTAQIDPTLLFPPTGNTYADANGNIVSSPSQGAVVGNLAGSFNASPTGAATYTVPIEVPQGIQGMQPNISLVYNSQSGNGIAGMCWNIGGLSMISRVPKDCYFDYERTGIIWDNTSPLALDGQRMIKFQVWGTDSIEYRTESGLDRIVEYNIKSWGPLTFKVYTKDGKILEYGNTAAVNSYYPIRLKKTASVETADSVYNLCWALTRISDANNNFIEFTYTGDLTSSSVYNDYKNIRISSISYGNQTGTTKEIVGRLDFVYKNRTNSDTSYIDGMEIANKYILDKVYTYGINASLLDTYQLTYTTLDQKDFLTQIKRTNTSGEFINPLQFDWSSMSQYNYTYNDSVYYRQTNFPDMINADFRVAALGDFDGDNRIDVVYKYKKGNDSRCFAYWNEGDTVYAYKGEFPWDKDYEKTFLFLDLDGDGKDELYVGRTKLLNSLYGYYLECYKYTNGSLVADVTGNIRIPIDATVYNDDNVKKQLYVISGDFKGEGKPQFILFKDNNKMVSQYGLDGINLNTFGGDASSKIFLSDINGNGKTEIAYRNGGTTTFYEYKQGSGFVSVCQTTQIAKNYDVYTGDFNGDGNTDIILKNRLSPYDWKYFISTGSLLIEKDISSYISSTVAGIHILDVNQDGKSDILFTTPNNGNYTSYTLKLLVSNGDGFISKTLNSSFGSLSKNQSVPGNFQRGHSKDLYLYGFYGISFGTTTYAENAEIISLNKNILFNKIIKITDSFNQTSTITYNDYKITSGLSLSGATQDGDYPDKNLNYNLSPEFEVISNIQATGINTTFTFSYPYIHKQSKGFLGFSTIQTTDNLRSITSKTVNNLNSSYYFLYPVKDTVKTTSGALISETHQTNTIIPGLFFYFLRQDSLVSTDYLKGITVKTSYSNYDTDRNPQTIKTDYGSDGIISTEALTYIKKGSLFLNKVSTDQITQSKTGQTDVVRKDYFFYDDKGNPTYHVADSTDVNKVQTVYSGYDKYGNPQKITTVANGVSRSKSMTYCSSGRFLKTETDNQLNQTVTYNYDEPRGLLMAKIDRIGTTSYQYDSFGRLKLTAYPDGIKIANALQWAGSISGKPANAKYYNYSETSGQSPVWVWYDNLGREIRRDSYGLNGKKIMIGTEYDSKSNIYRTTDPYFENTTQTYAATYTYDSYGRPLNTVTPMGTTAYAYSGLTTTVTSPTGTRKTTVNNAGWTTVEETNGKKVSFDFYASGLVKTATPEGGQALSMAYDLQGNRIKLIDPDAGVITSKYDGWGQLMREAQKINPVADSVVTTYNYYSSGLPNKKIRNGETTNYGYDNLYRLKWVSIAGKHAQGFTYDSYDRIIQTNDTVDGSKVFVSKTEYDLLGNVYRETYPSGYYITDKYDKYGYLTGVTDGYGSGIWQALESNAKGQLTRYSQGNNSTTVGIDSRGFPTSIVCPNIINLSYSFNSKGNLDYRQDNLTGYKESFNYDATNRLVNWSIYKNNVLQKSDNVTFNTTTGNIATKSDIGNFAMNYGENNNKPHALTSISGIPTGFADNLTVTYTDFKKIKTLTEGAKTYALSYGVDDQRIKSVYAVNGITQMTRYYLGDYEEEVSFTGSLRMIHYLGNGAIYINNNGKDSLLFTYNDYLGSLTALTDYNGTVLERYAFDPWGNRRNPGDWTQKDTRTSWRLNRGYTGHEHLDAFGIINMNGRVYDPLTAQFFSPDPYLQAPEDWLNYNRYSYCLNNPMLYTDQSGEVLGIFFRALIFVGDALSDWINGYGNPIGNAWKTSEDLTSRMGSCLQIPIVNN